MAFFSYPGGKSKLRKPILAAIQNMVHKHNLTEYREPFFGGGAIGLEVLEKIPAIEYIAINDFDPAVASLWTAVIQLPDQLIQVVKTFSPSVQAFNSFKSKLLQLNTATFQNNPAQILDIALMKLALHQMSYSGLGTKAGGPMGGQNPTDPAAIACRWSPAHLEKEILKTSRLISSRAVTTGGCMSQDFSDLFAGDPAMIYLDPPYFEQGGNLYQHAFSSRDHLRLAKLLQETQHQWLLSYDDCPFIRDLYRDWATIQSIEMTCTINGSNPKSELLISPR
jgi:DNA adenine methylase